MITKTDHRLKLEELAELPVDESKTASLVEQIVREAAQNCNEVLYTCICLLSVERGAHVRKLPAYAPTKAVLYRCHYYAAQRLTIKLNEQLRRIDGNTYESFRYLIDDALGVMERLSRLAFPRGAET